MLIMNVRFKLESSFSTIVTKLAGVCGGLTANPAEMVRNCSFVAVFFSTFFALEPVRNKFRTAVGLDESKGFSWGIKNRYMLDFLETTTPLPRKIKKPSRFGKKFFLLSRHAIFHQFLCFCVLRCPIFILLSRFINSEFFSNKFLNLMLNLDT